MSFRRAGIFVIGVASMAVAAGILWTFVRPERMSMMGTPMLLATFGLIVLPALVYLGCVLDQSRVQAPQADGGGVQGRRSHPTHAARAVLRRRVRESADVAV